MITTDAIFRQNSFAGSHLHAEMASCMQTNPLWDKVEESYLQFSDLIWFFELKSLA